MKNNPFKATYLAWFKTHDKSHIEYQRRKRYPWHIIGGIEFSDELIGVTQKILNKAEVLLGEAVIKNVTKRPKENKIQFDFQLRNDSFVDEFCVVFFNTGLLITIFDLGKDLEKDTIKKYLKGDTVDIFSRKLARLVLLEFVWRKLKGRRIYKKQKSFDKIKTKNATCIQPKDSFIVDISKQRDSWIFISLFEYEANPIELRYSNQCNNINSIFLVHSNHIPNRSPNKANIISIKSYFENSLSKNEIELLERLANDVVKYAKFK